MTADDVRGEDYEAGKPTATRTLVTGDPWVRSVRGHDPLCPIARETWCVWSGDACDHCRSIRLAREDALDRARAAVAALPPFNMHSLIHNVDYTAIRMGDALAAIDALRADHG